MIEINEVSWFRQTMNARRKRSRQAQTKCMQSTEERKKLNWEVVPKMVWMSFACDRQSREFWVPEQQPKKECNNEFTAFKIWSKFLRTKYKKENTKKHDWILPRRHYRLLLRFFFLLIRVDCWRRFYFLSSKRFIFMTKSDRINIFRIAITTEARTYIIENSMQQTL